MVREAGEGEKGEKSVGAAGRGRWKDGDGEGDVGMAGEKIAESAGEIAVVDVVGEGREGGDGEGGDGAGEVYAGGFVGDGDGAEAAEPGGERGALGVG